LAHTPIFDPPPEVTADVHLHSFEPPPDRLTQLRKAAAKSANLALDIADAEERLADLKARQHHLIHAEIPTLMTAAGVTAFTLAGSGNLPDQQVRLEAYYSGNIPISWPQERRRAAFETLEQYGAGHLIKTEVLTRFGGHEREAAKAFAGQCEAQGLSPDVREAVHHMQVGRWLKEQVKAGHPLPPLDAIGASIGQRAVLRAQDKD
jgi:hypothetical protein